LPETVVVIPAEKFVSESPKSFVFQIEARDCVNAAVEDSFC
jgi:hypothetical protein